MIVATARECDTSCGDGAWGGIGGRSHAHAFLQVLQTLLKRTQLRLRVHESGSWAA